MHFPQHLLLQFLGYSAADTHWGKTNCALTLEFSLRFSSFSKVFVLEGLRFLAPLSVLFSLPRIFYVSWETTQPSIWRGDGSQLSQKKFSPATTNIAICHHHHFLSILYLTSSLRRANTRPIPKTENSWIWKCTKMYWNVPKCIAMYWNVPKCIQMYWNISNG